MSILTKVEVKSWQGRLFLAVVTLMLIVGGSTMLYPFMIMFAGAMRSDMDAADMSVVPRYFVDETELVQKFLETKYNYNIVSMNQFLQRQNYSFRETIVPSVKPGRTSDFREFVAEKKFPSHWQELGGLERVQGVTSFYQEQLVKILRERFNGDLDAFNAAQGAPLESWWLINVRFRRWEAFRTIKLNNAIENAYLDLAETSEPHDLAYVNLSSLFLERMVYPAHGMQNVLSFNKAFDFTLQNFSDFTLSERVPSSDQPVYRKAWIEFLLNENVNLSFIRSDATDADYQAFLEKHFTTVERLRKYWHNSDYKHFSEIRLPDDNEWIDISEREAYLAFLKTLEPESLKLIGPEFAWRAHLKTRYASLEEASQAHDVTYSSWDDCQVPLAELEAEYVLGNKYKLRKRYALRNFRIVIRQMFVQGRSFYNTMIFVALALVFSLTLQPLVAYALSRFQPPGTWKFIFIFVATMAFPPMVSMIPQFLIIQKLGLLNTFIALVLPMTINGMMIFLLKGFFDSIPKDLYDAAVIDGASELRIFWTIAMAMSTPILAVVALQTFSGAWMSFLYPLIVCPDPKMHVLAVWLQQFQLEASGTAVFASIMIASFPSLLIFIFAQRTIMRGIAVPSEK